MVLYQDCSCAVAEAALTTESQLLPGLNFVAYFAGEDDSSGLHDRFYTRLSSLLGDPKAFWVDHASHQSTVIYICILKACVQTRSVDDIVRALYDCTDPSARPDVSVQFNSESVYKVKERAGRSIQQFCRLQRQL